MSQVTRVDIPVALGAANDIDDWARRLEAALDTLKREAALLEGCWGDDKFGQKFAESYLPFAEQTLGNADATVDSLKGVAENLRTIVHMFQELDTSGSHILELTDS